MSDRRTHPDAAAIAGFIDGTLPAQESRGVATHIAECDECVAEMGEISLFAAEERAAAPAKTAVRTWAYGLAAALAIAIVGSGGYVQWAGGLAAVRYRLRIRPITSVMAETNRPIEARPSGLPWSQKREVMRGGDDEGNIQLEGAADRVIEKTRDSSSPIDWHALGVAQLFSRYPDDRRAAPKTLSKAAAESHDPMVWNDLAVAHYQNGAYNQALEDVNHALTLRPDMREALFNRALILTQLQRNQEAIEGWNRYLHADPRSPWATEARENLARLNNPF